MRIAAVGALLILAAGLIGALLISSGDGEHSSGAETGSRPATKTYSLTFYAVEVPADWKLTVGSEPEGDRVESIWRNPADPDASILIEASTPAPRARPAPRAEALRAHASQSAGYRELDFGPISLAGRPAMRWVFELSGERRVEYFVNQCEVGITVHGSASPANFGALAGTFHKVASSVAVRCA